MTNIANDAKVSLINYPFHYHLLPSGCDLGERLISQSSASYPYRAILECLLNYPGDTLKTQFSTGHFSKDTARASMEAIDRTNGENKGLESCEVYCSASRHFNLLGPIH